jgi:hypothetical protein
MGEIEPKKYGSWGAKDLGFEFIRQINQFDPTLTNNLPLLHRSISGGKYIQSHDYFTGKGGDNYFSFVGNQLAEKLLKHKEQLPIWIK